LIFNVFLSVLLQHCQLQNCIVTVVVGKHMLGTLVDDDGKTDTLREKAGPLPLGPPQISHGVVC
jgi:hypothetical protein